MIDFEARREVASSQVTRIVTRSVFLELVTAATDATDAAEVVSRSAARTPPSTRAGGQDDGSLNKLPQMNIHLNNVTLVASNVNVNVALMAWAQKYAIPGKSR